MVSVSSDITNVVKNLIKNNISGSSPQTEKPLQTKGKIQTAK